MRVLLDTHTFLWFITADPKLSSPAQQTLAAGSNRLFMSLASVWEIAIKVGTGRLPIPAPLDMFIPEQLHLNRIALLPITMEHTFEVTRLPLHHRDPFDRIIIAQAMRESMPIVSADEAFDAYPIPADLVSTQPRRCIPVLVKILPTSPHRPHFAPPDPPASHLPTSSHHISIAPRSSAAPTPSHARSRARRRGFRVPPTLSPGLETRGCDGATSARADSGESVLAGGGRSRGEVDAPPGHLDGAEPGEKFATKSALCPGAISATG